MATYSKCRSRFHDLGYIEVRERIGVTMIQDYLARSLLGNLDAYSIIVFCTTSGAHFCLPLSFHKYFPAS